MRSLRSGASNRRGVTTTPVEVLEKSFSQSRGSRSDGMKEPRGEAQEKMDSTELKTRKRTESGVSGQKLAGEADNGKQGEVKGKGTSVTMGKDEEGDGKAGVSQSEVDSSARSDRPDERGERPGATGECKGDTSVKRDAKSEDARTRRSPRRNRRLPAGFR